MEYRQLGNTDIKVSVMAMGCWAIVDEKLWGAQDEEDAIAAIHACLDEGINFFDTAEGYGDGASEQLLARALGERRKEAVVASKVSPSHLAPDDLRAACERSLKNLNTDVIDLYQVHWPNWDLDPSDVMATLNDLRTEGKIRAIGVSNMGKQDLAKYIEAGRVESNQVMYSLLARAIEFDIAPMCREHNVGILCYSPLMQGLLTGKFESADTVPEGRARTRHFADSRPLARHGEDGFEEETFTAVHQIQELANRIDRPMSDVALAWVKNQPGVTSVIAGARNAEQARSNARGVTLPLAGPILDQLAQITEDLKEKLGSNADYWQSSERSRMR